MTVLKTDHLTRSPIDYAARISYPGMAHFAGTGPDGKYCRDCIHWDRRPDDRTIVAKPAPCKKYSKMMRGIGKNVPGSAFACKYFE